MGNFINSNYPFMLRYDKLSKLKLGVYGEYSFTDTPKFEYTNYTASDIKFPFDQLETRDTSRELYTQFANINYYDKNNNLITAPIDMIINKSALTAIADFYRRKYNYLKTQLGSNETYFNYINNNEDLFDVIKYLRLLKDKLIPDTYNRSVDMPSSNATIDELMKTRFNNLYNDKVDDETYYTKGVYRLRSENTAKFVNKRLMIKSDTKEIANPKYNKYGVLPMFKMYSLTEDIVVNKNIWIVIRGFRIPMKKVPLSRRYENNVAYYDVAYIMPEYLFKKYSNYYNAISFIEADWDLNDKIVYYGYNQENGQVNGNGYDNKYIAESHYARLYNVDSFNTARKKNVNLLTSYTGGYLLQDENKLSNINNISLYVKNEKYK